MSKYMLIFVVAMVTVAVAFPSQDNEDFLKDPMMRYPDQVQNLNELQHVSRIECGPSPAYENTPGMADWCREHCLHDPPFCPETQCRCW